MLQSHCLASRVEENPKGYASFMERGYNPHRRLESQAYSTISSGTLTDEALLAVGSGKEVMKASDSI
jgi:hypothetical protein